MIRAALLLLFSAGPAAAGCFAADGMPARAIYEGGSVLEYLGREGDVLTYRSGKVTSRVKDGIWPLENTGDGFRLEYLWTGDLPDLAAVKAAGGTARIEGERQDAKGKRLAVAAEVEILGPEEVEWEDCVYKALRLRKTMFAAGRKEAEGVVLYAPEAMIVFRTEAVDQASGKTFTYALEALE